MARPTDAIFKIGLIPPSNTIRTRSGARVLVARHNPEPDAAMKPGASVSPGLQQLMDALQQWSEAFTSAVLPRTRRGERPEEKPEAR